MKKRSRQQLAIVVRNLVFGVEDSVVSTVGLLSGIASAGVSTSTIFLTGTVLIFVEAFSMATGSFLSEESSEEIETRKTIRRGSFIASIIMFVSYFVSGFIPLGPYIMFPRDVAFVLSIAASLIALFILGIFSARISRVSIIRKGFEMTILGGLAILAGIVVGKIIDTLQ